MQKFVITSDNGGQKYWLCDGEGDPSRTLLLNSAKLFDTKEKAEKYKNKIISQNPHRQNLKDSLYIDMITMK